MAFGHKLRKTSSRLGRILDRDEATGPLKAYAGTADNRNARKAMTIETPTKAQHHGSAAPADRGLHDEREYTSDEDVEVDTITPARMDHLRRLADHVSAAS